MDLIVALLGLIVGFIINLLADSLPGGQSLGWPRCQACTAPRPFGALLGLGALITRTWRCLYCDTPRYRRVLLVEVFSVLGAIWLYRFEIPPPLFWPGLIAGTIFILIVVIDVEHKLILHAVSGSAVLMLGMLGIFDPSKGPAKTIIGGLVGFGLIFGLFLLGGIIAKWIANRRDQPFDEVVFGFGDVTLAGVVGLAVGWPGVLIALFIGVLAAGGYALIYILYMFALRRYRAFLAIPYGPFLVLGAWIIYFGGRNAIDNIFPNGPLLYLGSLILFFGGRFLVEFRAEKNR